MIKALKQVSVLEVLGCLPPLMYIKVNTHFNYLMYLDF